MGSKATMVGDHAPSAGWSREAGAGLPSPGVQRAGAALGGSKEELEETQGNHPNQAG